MNKEIYFDTFRGPGWPEPNQLAPYFLAPRGKEWCYRGGNDGWSISLEGVDGTAPLHRWKGRKDIELTMWGNPDLGVLLQYSRVGGGVPRQDWFSKGNLIKLKRWVRTMHADRPLHPLPECVARGQGIHGDRGQPAYQHRMGEEQRPSRRHVPRSLTRN